MLARREQLKQDRKAPVLLATVALFAARQFDHDFKRALLFLSGRFCFWLRLGRGWRLRLPVPVLWVWFAGFDDALQIAAVMRIHAQRSQSADAQFGKRGSPRWLNWSGLFHSVFFRVVWVCSSLFELSLAYSRRQGRGSTSWPQNEDRLNASPSLATEAILGRFAQRMRWQLSANLVRSRWSLASCPAGKSRCRSGT